MMRRQFITAGVQCAPLILLVALSVLASASAWAAKPGAADIKSLHREGSASLEQLFKAELASARKAGKQVVVMFTADWCQPCKNVKEFLEDSAVVQKAVSRGRFIFIDVDEWRGPAHALLAGINPTQLPVLVNVDYDGKPLQSCFGTDLGLISDQAVGHNLARLLAGQAPERLAILDDQAKQRELIVESAQKSKARVAHLPNVEVTVQKRKDLGGGQAEWRVRVFIQNHDQRRRWYAIPSRVGVPLAPEMQVESWKVLRFNEHVRAYVMRFDADPPFGVVPLAGLGSVELADWVLVGPASTPTIEIWELNDLKIDGKPAEFDKKVPFELRVSQSTATTLLGGNRPGARITMPPAKKTPVTLK